MKTESSPPPKIGKIGPYTVFITPNPVHSPKTLIPGLTRPPPVQAPPMHYSSSSSSSSAFGFFWDALTTLQNAHASLDQKTAYWFGLDQSKFQWALDHYYQNNGIAKGIKGIIFGSLPENRNSFTQESERHRFEGRKQSTAAAYPLSRLSKSK